MEMDRDAFGLEAAKVVPRGKGGAGGPGKSEDAHGCSQDESLRAAKPGHEDVEVNMGAAHSDESA
jgi:hypothetical protein